MWSKNTRTSAPGYRQEIDGLRALAVLAVLFFHLRRAWLPGGFVGVDVFFVISGYVVSHSLAARDARPVASYLAHFYQRRVKRLLPALAVCCLLSAFLVSRATPPMPAEFNIGSYRTGLFALFGLSNFYLIRLSGSYFDGDLLPNPFLHTWSLGVEEQFYLVLPLLFCLLRSAHDDRRTNQLRLSAVGLLCLASLWLSAAWTEPQPTWAYYLMPSRFWELGLGSVIASAERLGLLEGARQHPWLKRLGPWLGLLLLASAVWYTPQRGFPFPGALPAVTATLLLLVTARSPGQPVVRFLASKPATYVGRLSYSLYLWHWPIIAVVTRTVGLHDALGLSLAACATLLAAMASFHLIESPVRYAPAKSPRSVLIAAAGLLLITATLTELIGRRRALLYAGSSQHWLTDWSIPAQQPLFETGQLSKADCHLVHGAELPTSFGGACLVRPQGAVSRMLFAVGDSHSNANWPMLKAGVSAGAYGLYALSHDSCEVRSGPPSQGDSCDGYWPYVHRLIAQHAHAGDIVMLAAYLREYTPSRPVEDEIRSLARSAGARGAKLVLQSPLPKHQRRAFDCLPAWFVRPSSQCLTPKSKDLRAARDSIEFARRIAGQEPNVVLWDPYELLCPEEMCGHFRAGRPIFRDDDHLASWGSRSLGRPFLSFLRQHALVTP